MLKEILIDFGIPAMLIAGAFTLLGLGIDGEVKAILLMAAGWCFHSGYKYKKGGK